MSMFLNDSRAAISGSGDVGLRGYWRNRSVLEKRLIIVTTTLTFLSVGLVIAVILLGIRETKSTSNESGCTSINCLRDSLSILESVNLSADPCDDFYLYACGKYLTDNKIVDGQLQYTALNNLDVQNTEVIKEMLKTPANGNQDIPINKARKMFATCINEHGTDDSTPILKLIKKYGGWSALEGKRETNITWDNIINLMATGGSLGGRDGILQLTVMPSFRNNTQYLIYILDPEEQLLTTANENLTKTAIKTILIRLNAKNKTDEFLDEVANGIIEVNNFISTQVKQFKSHGINFTENYRFWTVSELSKNTDKKFDWESYFQRLLKILVPEITVDGTMEIVVNSADYFKNLCKNIGESQLAEGITTNELLDYITFQLIRQLLILTNVTKSLTAEERVILHPKKETHGVILGKKSARQRSDNEDLCTEIVTEAFSYAIAKEFAESLSVERNRLLAEEITEEIIAVVKQRLQNIDWMDEATKNQAFEKINNLKKFYLYPDWVGNETKLQEFYKELNVTENHFNNFINFIKKRRYENFRLLVTPPAVNIWEEKPTTVNAFYSPQDNSINILLGILQSPVIDSERPSVMNYAALGAILGHEITHGFDLTGRQFDEKGNLRNWWTDTVTEVFNKKAECFEEQYNAYTLNKDYIEGIQPVQMNGTLTLSENIADNGGVQQAFTAFKKKMDSEGEEKRADFMKNFTTEQIFFLQYAQLWCAKYLPIVAQVLAMSDHSPNPFRVLGPLQNFPEFAKAFNCPSNSKMNPNKEPCKLW